MNEDYPQHSWTSADSDKISDAYIRHVGEMVCPACGGTVEALRQEGPEHLKKEYVDSNFFVQYTCQKCGRRDTRTYGKR